MLEHTSTGIRGTGNEASVLRPGVIWLSFLTHRLQQAQMDQDLETFRNLLSHEPALLGAEMVGLQARLMEVFSWCKNSLPFMQAMLNANAAVFTVENPPPTQAVSYAVEYGYAGYVPILSRIWPVPNDLPHAAGLGDHNKVSTWFTDNGEAVLGDPSNHNPFPSHFPNVTAQDILDRALAWAVQNGEYDIADFLLERGADINTRWSTHEPASIMHECVCRTYRTGAVLIGTRI